MARVRTRTPEANRRPDVEEFLLKYHVTHTYKEGVSPSAFDFQRSLRNQARMGAPLDEATVKTYVAALLQGDTFPPVLAHQSGEDLIVLDGNHRLAAHREAEQPLDVYVCEAPTATLTMITFIANTKHGRPASLEDRLHHALFLVDGGMNIPDAAAAMSLSLPELRRAIAKRASSRRADDAGVLRTDWERIPAAARVRLHQIHTDEGFGAAVALVREAALTSTEVDKLVASMNATKNAAKQRGVVNSMRLAYAERIAEVKVVGGPSKQGHRTASPRTRLGMVVGQMIALPPAATYRAESLPEEVRAELVKRIGEALVRLTEIEEALS